MSDKQHPAADTGSPSTPAAFRPTTMIVLVLLISAVLATGLIMALGDKSKPVSNSIAQELAQAKRLQKVGAVALREDTGNRPLRVGEEVYKGQCAACHATGVSNAPKFADAAAWGPRLSQGFEALVQSALKGKGAMAPQGGGSFSDLEIARGVAYLANAGGANFTEPEPPAN